MWSILLLGAPQLLQADAAIQIPRRKNRALLYYLAAHAKPLTRDQILAFFFIDHERAAAQQILRTMLHDLRKQLGDAFIAQAETIALAQDIFVDARVFEANLQTPSAASQASDRVQDSALLLALQLYRGEFLEGFTLDDAPEFDEWLTRERERYRALAARGWMQLAAIYENERDFARALDALERALTFDELNEEAQQRALRAQYLNGDRAGAIRRFERLQKKLDQELGVPPLAETRAVYDALVTDTLQAENPAPGPTDAPRKSASQHTLNDAPKPISVTLPPSIQRLPFVGRTKELERLRDAAAAGSVIWLEGEPGIGRTRLAEEFIAAPANADAFVLRANAHELEQNLPYQPIIGALRGLYAQPEWATLAPLLELDTAWWAELARLTPELSARLPDLPPALANMDEARVWEAFYQLLAQLGATRRVIFFLDDAQWAAAATLGLVGYLARHASPTLVLLVAARAVDLPPSVTTLLRTLTRQERLARVEMSALSARDLETLSAQLSPAHAAQLARWLNENAEGNPFFVNELLHFLYAREVLQRDGALAPEMLALTTILTPTIRNLIQARLMHLNDNARRVLASAGVIGRVFEYELVQRVAELSEDATLDALDVLQRAGLARAVNEGAYAFDHQLTMQAVLEELGAARQRVLHRRVADALNELHRENLDAVAGLIARHYMAAGAPARAAAFALRAGEHARTFAAWADAIAFYQIALDAETDDGRRAQILSAMGEAQFHCADFVLATESYRQSLELASARRDLALMEQALLALTQALFPQARYAEAIAAAQEMRESGPPELNGAAEFAWGTTLAVESVHPIQAERHLQRAEKLLARPLAYPSQITPARRKYQLAAVWGQRGKSAEAVAGYRAALALAQADPNSLDLTRCIMLYNNLAYHLLLLGEQTAAADAVQAGICIAQERGSTSHLPYLLSTSGEIALARGDLDAAEKFFSEGLAAAHAIPLPERVAGNTANLGLVASARGETDKARALLANARARADALGSGHLAVRIRIWLAPLLPPADARVCLQEARAIAVTNGYAGLLREIAALEKNA